MGRFQLSLEAGTYDIVVEPPDLGMLFGCVEKRLNVTESCHHRRSGSGHRLKGHMVFDDHLLSQSLVRVQRVDGQKQEYNLY